MSTYDSPQHRAALVARVISLAHAPTSQASIDAHQDAVRDLAAYDNVPVQHVQLVPVRCADGCVNHIPDVDQDAHQALRTWTPGDQATAARILGDHLGEYVSDYGAALVIDALASALAADLASAADLQGRRILGHAYRSAAHFLQGIARSLAKHETDNR